MIQALGIEIFLNDSGEGPPTLFLHGNPDSADLWDGVTPKMKRMVLRLYRTTDPENFRGWEGKLRDIVARVPTLVLWGDHDPYIRKRYARTFGTDNIRHFPDHGHWLPAEAPVQVAAALNQHFSDATAVDTPD